MINKSALPEDATITVGVSSTARCVVGRCPPISVKMMGIDRQTGEKSASASIIRPLRSEHAAERHACHTPTSHTSVMSEFGPRGLWALRCKTRLLNG
ncbi:hypothetical protein IG631_22330 [Alternaria alternata]|nr:hypothetical protein IG631_22330 [Alternaria alternata]